jgi:hypothetical protein
VLYYGVLPTGALDVATQAAQQLLM